VAISRIKESIKFFIGYVSFKVSIVLRKFNVIIFKYPDMFGHQTWNPEYHIRRHILIYGSFPKVIGIQNTSFIPNLGLYEHHKKYGINVLPPNNNISVFFKLGMMYQKSLPGGNDSIASWGVKGFSISTMENILSNDLTILTNSCVSMPLLKFEEEIADKFYAKYNLKRKEYFCFRDRDNSYMLKKYDQSHELKKRNRSFVIREYNENKGNNILDRARNTSLNVFYKGSDMLAKRGVKSVRVGASSSLKCSSDVILDYSFSIRDNDIIDILLVANSKFLVAPPTGDGNLGMAFNVPLFIINVFPWPYINIPFMEHSMYMPKKIWLKKEKRFMKISEMALLEKKHKRNEFSKENIFQDLGIEPIENTEDEIAYGISEMNDRLDGIWNIDRDIYADYLTESNISRNSKAKLSTTFLELNPELI
jgi:putative glycosyltransferase (TIGR04372 family)